MQNHSLIGEDLEGGEERFKLLLDTLPHMAFAIFSGGHAEYYNHAFIAYYGFDPGPDKASRTALLHPDDRHVLEAARQSSTPFDREYIVEARLRRHDGVYRWHRIHNAPLIRGGRRVGYIGTAVDIHDAKLAHELLERRVAERTAALQDSETRYRMLYNRTPLALHSIDRSSRLIDVNDTWMELFGWKREEVLGRPPTDFMTPESIELYRQRAWPEMLASRGEVCRVEYRFVTRDGRLFDGRVSARGEFDADGQFIRSWSAIEDITAERRAQQELRQAQRMDAVGQLTAGIAHDFNNLLTAISGNLELLARNRDRDERSLRLIDGARTAAARGARLTSQLLAFSRQQPIAAEPVDLNALVDGMRPLLQSTIGATIAIQPELDGEIGHALGDPTQLELAVLNLAINARDAMPAGGALTIQTGQVVRGAPTRPEEPEPGCYVSLSVADTGSGMSAAVRERIFEPFFTTKAIGKGSGLGLPHVLGVIKQLGGGVEVRSRPGEGTCFTLFLPPAPATQVPGEGPEASPPEPAAPRSLRLFVVDDDADVRGIAAEMLRDAGHEVQEFGSGPEALQGLEQARPDVLVADVAMPGMNGVELAEAARRRWPGLRVLFMTGFAEQRILPRGAKEQVLRKPFGAAELAARVAGAAKEA
ncbi:MAG: PAS domain S-box protein [Acetobacteraceae bacterium]|nr:PAS domain S-box protein [Acetobacteraceae bacterium]